ncbi:MAG: HEAT repeat domain-containing protein [Bacteroidota bacterium]
MGFYSLSKEERKTLVRKIDSEIFMGFTSGDIQYIIPYFSDRDTYIRKAGYLAVGKLNKGNHIAFHKIIGLLNHLLESKDEKIRQTTVNAAGELGKTNFEEVAHFFDMALFDDHHSVRNAVIGSIKKMGERNPKPVLTWAKKYLHHPNKEVRREICHGIELRGRKYPQDILPLLRSLQHDNTARVQKTLIHVIGQISYKKGCLKIVIEDLISWDNPILVKKALDEIVDVHHRYKSFAALSLKEATDFIERHYIR